VNENSLLHLKQAVAYKEVLFYQKKFNANHRNNCNNKNNNAKYNDLGIVSPVNKQNQRNLNKTSFYHFAVAVLQIALATCWFQQDKGGRLEILGYSILFLV
jgi:hypothetical protein